MNEIKFIGENLWIHHFGHALIFLSFIAAGFAAFSYLKDSLGIRRTGQSGSWKMLGRIGFTLHTFSILSVIGMLFFAMGREMYEYYYVFQHVNSELPKEYIFSAFWEGQEGSFMLWMFWHAILGMILLIKGGKWESPVLMVVALAQFLINLMLLGIYIEIGDLSTKIGINPIVLLRESMEAPIFSNADYLSLIDGNGLNPLLQNYWNVIHPPVLFLGFASVLIPFSYAVGGLVTGLHKEWLKPALGWALFSAGIFGTGILMGGAWAYEALSFGGYWAWDPVENSSFVPWLTLVAGIHTHLIAKNTGYSIRSTYFLYILSFVLVLYSTFLTRSGVLGDTSVHAFTELGLESQLLLLVLSFVVIGFGLFVYNYNKIPEPKREESIYSREFWMFIGSLVLLFSAVLIISSTSLPVYNEIRELFNPDYQGVVINDPIEHYNKYQIWIAIFIGSLSAVGVFLRYKAATISPMARKKLLIAIGTSAGLSILLTILFESILNLYTWQYSLLAFMGFFALTANLFYILKTVKQDPRMIGAGMAHVGFGLLIIGVLASGLNDRHITRSLLSADILRDNPEERNLTLLLEDQPIKLGNFQMLYKGDTIVDKSRIFEVEFNEYNNKGEIIDNFTLFPSALMDIKMQKVQAFIPDTKHSLEKDIFIHGVGLPPSKRDAEEARALEDSLNYITYEVAIGDTFQTPSLSGILEGISFVPSNPNFNPDNSDFAVEAKVKLIDPDFDTLYNANPVLSLDNALIITIADQINPLETKIRINDAFMGQIILPGDQLNYEQIVLKSGESMTIQGHKIQLKGFLQDPKNRSYQKKEGDIVVAAKLMVDDEYEANPIFLIRDNQPFYFNEFIPQAGIHIRFININPKEEIFTFLVAKQNLPENLIVPLDIAEDAGRNDWLYLEARIFPGINIFWVGSILMMLGFLYAMCYRWWKKIA